MEQQRDFYVGVQAPSLPKGGGAIQGMGESLGVPGPSGQASMSLPLPISVGRGFSPMLELSYSSGSGNGVFGMGWSCSAMSVSRRTNHGVPQYAEQDEFLGPDGEVLVAALSTTEDPNPRQCNTYGTKPLAQEYTVTRYLPRIESGGDRIEHWLGADGGEFWLVHDLGGNLHMLGKTSAGRISDPAMPAHTAIWLLEESVAPTGEHVYYRYAAENEAGLDLSGNEASRDRAAMRYLVEALYGNLIASPDLFLWDSDSPQQQWLFSIVFDYGERSLDPVQAPPYVAAGAWLSRSDPFSTYAFGFELRTHRLCRQVLMFHHFPEELGAPQTLVARLLLEYQQQTSLSMLSAAQRFAYEPDGLLQQHPPLELLYSPSAVSVDPARWQAMPPLPGLDDGQRYQLVDLYGEGVAGVLHRTDNAWLYKAPQRGTVGDEVEYGDWQPLSGIPSAQSIQSRLVDMDGNGQLDWLVAQPGLAGVFTVRPDRSWSSFMPFTALPTEFFHPAAQFAELLGSGLADLALVGPKSVRLYANERDGFAAGIDIEQGSDITLPVPGRNARELVAFADVLGSGQSHLLRVRHDSVTCWPNLGHGRFGMPIDLPLPEAIDLAGAFNPERLFLADIDGSGAADLIYAHHDRVCIFMNRCGNGFESMQALLLPPGVVYDRLCQILLADIQGNGMAELVLSVPYMAPSHWRYPFNTAKPYLLNEINNNMGAGHRLSYRSSAQEWLDEKQADPSRASALPFAMHLLVQVITHDEITGNTLSQRCRYRQGVYDGKEREFRGFGYLEVEDTDSAAMSVGKNVPLAMPLLRKAWYHCGREQDEFALYAQPYAGDPQALALNPTRLTRFDNGEDVTLTDADAAARWWLFRAMKGALLRSESYGVDGSSAQPLPYGCTISRSQLRLLQPGAIPVVMVFTLEQATTNYERLPIHDPMVSQTVTLQRDRYGHPLWGVSVSYPRRAEQALTPYPPNLPSDAWGHSYDDQQQKLRLAESRTAVIHLEAPEAWRLGLPHQSRTNILVYDVMPDESISFETLTASDGLLGDAKPRYFAGQAEVIYVSSPPDLRALVAYQRSAVLDDVALQAYDGVVIPPEYDWASLGYVSTPTLLPVAAPPEPENPVWAVESGFTTYADASGFYRPLTQQVTKRTGAITTSYDGYWLCAIGQADVYGNTASSRYDYRFLAPTQTTDINGNVQEVQLSALGLPMGGSFYGTEAGEAAGFGSVTDYPVSATLTVEQAIAEATTVGYRQQIVSISVPDWFSWMGQVRQRQVTPEEWAALCAARLITTSGHVRLAGRRWAAAPYDVPGIPYALASLLKAAGGNPVHAVVLQADRYPDSAEQQTRIQLSYSDGFGRVLQQCGRVAAGMAWHLEEDGEVSTAEVPADPRWVVTGRVEYDDKGQLVRAYQPYFLDSWRYVIDSSLRTQGYSDTHHYDALGRRSQTVTALGYLRRSTYYPWFDVQEDENDTLGLV